MARYTANGVLDNTFDTDGMIIYPVGIASNDYGRDIAVQPDGKIVVAGTAMLNSGGMELFAVTRLNTDGSLDLLIDSLSRPNGSARRR